MGDRPWMTTLAAAGRILSPLGKRPITRSWGLHDKPATRWCVRALCFSGAGRTVSGRSRSGGVERDAGLIAVRSAREMGCSNGKVALALYASKPEDEKEISGHG